VVVVVAVVVVVVTVVVGAAVAVVAGAGIVVGAVGALWSSPEWCPSARAGRGPSLPPPVLLSRVPPTTLRTLRCP